MREKDRKAYGFRCVCVYMFIKETERTRKMFHFALQWYFIVKYVITSGWYMSVGKFSFSRYSVSLFFMIERKIIRIDVICNLFKHYHILYVCNLFLFCTWHHHHQNHHHHHQYTHTFSLCLFKGEKRNSFDRCLMYFCQNSCNFFFRITSNKLILNELKKKNRMKFHSIIVIIQFNNQIKIFASRFSNLKGEKNKRKCEWITNRWKRGIRNVSSVRDRKKIIFIMRRHIIKESCFLPLSHSFKRIMNIVEWHIQSIICQYHLFIIDNKNKYHPQHNNSDILWNGLKIASSPPLRFRFSRH